jgi:hypothetical protein
MRQCATLGASQLHAPGHLEAGHAHGMNIESVLAKTGSWSHEAVFARPWFVRMSDAGACAFCARRQDGPTRPVVGEVVVGWASERSAGEVLRCLDWPHCVCVSLLSGRPPWPRPPARRSMSASFCPGLKGQEKLVAGLSRHPPPPGI